MPTLGTSLLPHFHFSLLPLLLHRYTSLVHCGHMSAACLLHWKSGWSLPSPVIPSLSALGTPIAHVLTFIVYIFTYLMYISY